MVQANGSRSPLAPSAKTSPPDGALTPSQLQQFQRDGYLVLPNFFDPEPYLERARTLVRSFDPAQHPLTKFTTGEAPDGGGGGKDGESHEHVGNRYFLESGDKLRYFLEQDAVSADGSLNREPERSVNKCGHALHALDPVFHDLSFSSRVQALVRSVGAFSDPRTLQSMIICKQPSIGGAVPSHNDSTFLYTDPPSAMGLWFALEDCTASNGSLSFLAGSHLHDAASPATPPPPRYAASRPRWPPSEYGVARGVNRRFVRRHARDTEQGTEFVALADAEEAQWDEGKARVEECKAGSLVLIHGSVLHQSKKNLSDRSRYIYTFHVIEGDGRVARYDEKNWFVTPK